MAALAAPPLTARLRSLTMIVFISIIADQVRAGIAQGKRDSTINSSNGGFVFAAPNIAREIEAAGASLTVNRRCWSACSMIALETHATLTAEADVRSHSSYVPGGGDSDDVAQVLVAHGLPASLGRGPNLQRIDGSAPAPAGP